MDTWKIRHATLISRFSSKIHNDKGEQANCNRASIFPVDQAIADGACWCCHRYATRSSLVELFPCCSYIASPPSAERPPTWPDTPINNEYMNMKISMRIRPPYIHGDGCSQCRDYISTHASYRNAHRSIGRFDREHAAVLRVYEFRVYYRGTHFRIGGIAGIIWSTDIFIDTG